MTSLNELKNRSEQAICHTYGRYPIAVAKAHGARLVSPDGTEYIDLLAGIAVANCGHARPEIAEAIYKQALELVHVSNLFYTENQITLAERLLKTAPHAGKVFFANSGAEANEAAVKLARRYARTVKGKDAYKVITLIGSFHGRTLAMIAATGQDRIKAGFEPTVEGFVHVPFGDLSALAAAIDDQTAAVLVEMVQGEGGVRPMTTQYAQNIERLCRERGALFMVDEIQTGLGRTGKFWGFEHFGVKPDVFTSAKGLANGLPMGAMICTDQAAKGFAPGTHASTFGGGPVVAAAALATLDILEHEKLVERSAHIGAQLAQKLNQLKSKHPTKIHEIRGLGLMVGIELSSPAQAVFAALLEQGFVLNLTQDTILRLLPPLTIPEADLDAFVNALDGVLAP